MKICMIAPIMVASRQGIAFTGGSTNSMIRLLKGLKGRHKIAVIAGSPELTFNALKKIEFPWAELYPIKIKSQPHSIFYGLEFLIKAILCLRRIQKDEKCDMIHIHSGYSYYSLLGVIEKRLFNIPAIHTLYCPITSNVFDKNKRAINKIISKFILSQMNKIIAISTNVANSLKQIGLSDNQIEIIPPSVDSTIFNPNRNGNNVRLKFGVDGPLVLFIGNLTKTKGIDILIEAIGAVVKTYPQIKLIMALDVSEKSTPYELGRKKILYERVNQLGIKENIIELGIVENLAELIAASDLFVAPFRSTAGPADYPLSILEAMAVGKLVITTRVGGISEIIEDRKTGILIEPDNGTMLAETILEALKDEKMRRRIGENASEYVLKNFPIEVISKKMGEVYLAVKGGINE